MTQQSAIPLFDEVVKGFDKLSTSGHAGRESSDLRKTRQSAFDKFRLLGFPTIKNEDWKYTNIVRFLKDEYALEATPLDITPAIARAAIGGLESYRVTLVNGVWNGVIEGGPLPAGVQLLSVAAARQDPALSVYFEKADWGNHHFAALNTALFTDGLFLRVDAGMTVEKPLHIVHVFTADRNLLVQPRHVWVLQRNAGLSVIESVVSTEVPGAAGADAGVKIWVNSYTELLVHTDARLDHAVIQTAGSGVRLVQHTTVRQKKQSLYNNYTFTLPGADLVRNDLQARLEEDHTETHLYGLYLAAGHQLVDNHTLVDHQKPHCFSNELYKGVLLEQATGVFNGKVFVHQDAQKTNAFQQNNNLVISKRATIDSKPELEIYADDVKCSHGSTVGQFSEEALFYLRARGIGEDTAKALLINAFAFDVTEKIKIPEVETHVNELISHHIPQTHA